MFNYLAGKFRRITSNQAYMAEIDGMRFLAIFLVGLFHIHGYFIRKTEVQFTDDPNHYYWFNTFINNGDKGVLLFFSISGFILCLPFANHYIKGGKIIILKNYYLRRVTRLEPPYFIIMILIFAAQVIKNIYPFKELLPHLFASLLYSHNFIYHHTPLITVVAWSLEIEIQYYIIAPFLFRLLALQKALRRALITAAILIFVVLQTLYPPHFLSIYGNIQYFLTGILLADFYVCGFAKDFFKMKWLAWTALAVFFIMFLMPKQPGIFLELLFPFMIGLFYYIILNNKTVKNIFSYKFVPIIGGMCYTIYLLHYTIISMIGVYTIKIHFTDYYFPNLFLQFVILMTVILAVSSVFYLCIERPFMDKNWVNKLLKWLTGKPGLTTYLKGK